jgi:hypothetical protein
MKRASGTVAAIVLNSVFASRCIVSDRWLMSL